MLCRSILQIWKTFGLSKGVYTAIDKTSVEHSYWTGMTRLDFSQRTGPVELLCPLAHVWGTSRLVAGFHEQTGSHPNTSLKFDVWFQRSWAFVGVFTVSSHFSSSLARWSNIWSKPGNITMIAEKDWQSSGRPIQKWIQQFRLKNLETHIFS